MAETLQPQTTYYVRLKPEDADGNPGEWSVASQFTMGNLAQDGEKRYVRAQFQDADGNTSDWSVFNASPDSLNNFFVMILGASGGASISLSAGGSIVRYLPCSGGASIGVNGKGEIGVLGLGGNGDRHYVRAKYHDADGNESPWTVFNTGDEVLDNWFEIGGGLSGGGSISLIAGGSATKQLSASGGASIGLSSSGETILTISSGASISLSALGEAIKQLQGSGGAGVSLGAGGAVEKHLTASGGASIGVSSGGLSSKPVTQLDRIENYLIILLSQTL